jgi:hypothetical protein
MPLGRAAGGENAEGRGREVVAEVVETCLGYTQGTVTAVTVGCAAVWR